MTTTRRFLAILVLHLLPISAFAQGEIRKPAERPVDMACSDSTVPTRTAGAGMLLTCLDGTIYSGNGSTWTKAGSGGGSGVGSASPNEALWNNAGNVDGFGSWDGTRFNVEDDDNSVSLGLGGVTTFNYITTPSTTGFTTDFEVEMDVDADDPFSKVGAVFKYTIDDEGAQAYGYIEGVRTGLSNHSVGTFEYLMGTSQGIAAGPGTATNGITGVFTSADSAGIAPYIFAEHLALTTSGATIPYGAATWIDDLSTATSCPYAFYYDGNNAITATAGVYRINGLGIMAYYNPAFTKYTPCAVNYERIVQQWNTNVAEYGTEVGAGGGNVQRKLRLLGANLEIKSSLTPAVTDTSADSCGSGTQTIAGNDNVGKVTVIGSGGTSCTVTFATAFANAPSCQVSNETTAALARATSTTGTVVLAGVFLQNDVLAYSCIGR